MKTTTVREQGGLPPANSRTTFGNLNHLSAIQSGHIPVEYGVNDFAELAPWVVQSLNTDSNADCRVLGFRRIGRKVLIEFEVISGKDSRCNGASQLYIGKIYKDERGLRTFQAQSQLWELGLRPPSPFTVVRP